MYIVGILANGTVKDLPAPYEQYRIEIQTFVDRHELLVGQAYIVMIEPFKDRLRIRLCIIEDIDVMDINQL